MRLRTFPFGHPKLGLEYRCLLPKFQFKQKGLKRKKKNLGIFISGDCLTSFHLMRAIHTKSKPEAKKGKAEVLFRGSRCQECVRACVRVRLQACIKGHRGKYFVTAIKFPNFLLCKYNTLLFVNKWVASQCMHSNNHEIRTRKIVLSAYSTLGTVLGNLHMLFISVHMTRVYEGLWCLYSPICTQYPKALYIDVF